MIVRPRFWRGDDADGLSYIQRRHSERSRRNLRVIHAFATPRSLAITLGMTLTLLFATFSQAADKPSFDLQLLLRGLEDPVYLTHDGTKRIFICEQPGRLRLIVDGQLQ